MPINFERSADTDAAINVLRGVNHEIAYIEAARRAGLGLQRFKAVLPSARRALSNEGILFGVITGQGLKRLTDADKVKKPEAFKKRVFRGAGRELKHLATISDFGALSKADQHSVTLNRTVLNAMRKSAAVKSDEAEKPVASPQPIPNVALLASFKAKP